jgi:REP element-mobilizing transposase RayT
MKNRDYKNFSPESFVHIFNRGNNKEKIFLDEQDCKAFLFRFGLALGFNEDELQKESFLSLPHSRVRITNTNKNDFRLHVFCLMPNHFHLIVEQLRDVLISNLILKVCTSYAMYFNKKYKRVGHVFQDKFKAVLIEDDPQLMWTSAYIHMNPIKDGIVKSPELYKWSSYKDYVGERNLSIITKDLLLELFGDKNSFKKETLNYFKKEDEMSRPVLDIDIF